MEFKAPRPKSPAQVRARSQASCPEELKPAITKIVVDRVLGSVAVTEDLWRQGGPYEILDEPRNRLPDYNDERRMEDIAGWPPICAPPMSRTETVCAFTG